MNGYFSILQNGLNGYWEKISVPLLHTKIHLEERWEEHFIVNQNHSLDIARRQKYQKKFMKLYNHMINIPFALSPTKMCFKKVCKKTNTNVLYSLVLKILKNPDQEKASRKMVIGRMAPPSISHQLSSHPCRFPHYLFYLTYIWKT